MRGDRTTSVGRARASPAADCTGCPAGAHRPRPARPGSRRRRQPSGQPAGARPPADRAGPLAGLGPQPSAAPARRPHRVRGAGRRRPRRSTPLPQGTPASRIHWPAVARGAGLIERQLQADGDARPLVVLDARTPASAAGPSLISRRSRPAAASLVLEFGAAGGCGLLLPGEQRPTVIDRELISWPAAYARLALVEGGSTSRLAGTGLCGGAGRGDDLCGRITGGAPGGDPQRAGRRPDRARRSRGRARGRPPPRGAQRRPADARPSRAARGFVLGAGRQHGRTRPEDLARGRWRRDEGSPAMSAGVSTAGAIGRAPAL